MRPCPWVFVPCRSSCGPCSRLLYTCSGCSSSHCFSAVSIRDCHPGADRAEALDDVGRQANIDRHLWDFPISGRPRPHPHHPPLTSLSPSIRSAWSNMASLHSGASSGSGPGRLWRRRGVSGFLPVIGMPHRNDPTAFAARCSRPGNDQPGHAMAQVVQVPILAVIETVVRIVNAAGRRPLLASSSQAHDSPTSARA